MLNIKDLNKPLFCEFCNEHKSNILVSGDVVEDSVICKECLYKIVNYLENERKEES